MRITNSLTLVLATCTLAADRTPPPVSFNRDIKPIMADTCFRCHGPDKGSRMANLRLDLREEAVKPRRGGAAPIVPGDAEKSLIIARIYSAEAAKAMPPESAHRALTAAQKDLIRRWVAEGAKYEGHWAYQPVARPQVPRAGHPQLPQAAPHPIDAFVDEKLGAAGLKPLGDADARTLLRRVTLDLTGLPPTVEQLNAFLNDKAPGAYERAVDRLLTSTAYAEKQAMHWLDAVRYADTAGFHGDNIFPAWPYRDWVLKAFRDNLPFDEFTRLQLAGDLMPNATADQKTASAFNRLNRVSAEGGVQPKEYLAKYGADRVRTVATVWLGSTIGCAECHDHKFDPFLSRDFYSMKAFFSDVDELGLMPDRGPEAFGAKMRLPSAEQSARMAVLEAQLAAAKRSLDMLPRTEVDWQASDLPWKFQTPAAVRALNGAVLRVDKEVVIAGGPNPDTETYVVDLKPGAGTWNSLGLEVVEDEELPGGGHARGADRFIVTEVEAALGTAKLGFSLATSGLLSPMDGLPAMAAIDGDPQTGWGIASYQPRGGRFLALRFERPVATTADSVITVRLRQESEYRRATMGRFRLALSSRYSWPGTGRNKTGGLPDDVIAALKVEPAQRTEAQNDALDRFRLWASPEATAALAAIGRLEAEIDVLQSQIPQVMVTRAVSPRETRVLARGNFMDESSAVVEPAIPGFLGRLEGPATRLDLANWIVSRSNPLTARVYVNRLWREFFGFGLTRTLDDLGSQGEVPSHPELLDWLAAEFMERWDMRHMVRLIVTSKAYRRSSVATPELEAVDPDNRLLARQNRLRVDAETVRDISLSVSGLLQPRFGGPSVRPYQPDGYLAALNFPKREYSASHGDDLYRRGLYTLWQRTFLHPSTAIFDAPTREECTVNRTNSNTPLQSLVLLNDPIFVEAARVFASRLMNVAGLDARLDRAFLLALGRAPFPQERRALTALYSSSLVRFRKSEAEAAALIHTGEAAAPANLSTPELASMTVVTRAILNLHETITRN